MYKKCSCYKVTFAPKDETMTLKDDIKQISKEKKIGKGKKN